MGILKPIHRSIVPRLDGVGQWLAPLGLRLVLAWEYFEAGREKYLGSNWFGELQSRFPFPFDQLPAEASWQLATWAELAGATMLLFGLGTRVAAYVLLVLTVVATAAVHWPGDWTSLSGLAQGYAITDDGHGNFKLPLIFMAMLLPLMLQGAGRCSLDAALSRRQTTVAARADVHAWALCLLGLGLPMAMLLPRLGLPAAAIGIALFVYGSRNRSATLHG